MGLIGHSLRWQLFHPEPIQISDARFLHGVEFILGCGRGAEAFNAEVR